MVVTGVSGLAASRRNPGLFYVVSDAAGTSDVVAVREDGTLVARTEVEGMSARNAEDLAVGSCGGDTGDSCLYVGDIGDHVGRDDIVVYRVVEPDLTDPPAEAVAAEVLRFSYPDAASDAEALLVDDTGRPLIVTKATFDSDTGATGPTRLYRGGAGGGVLEFLGELDLPEPAAPVFAELVGNVVTGADSHDGKVLIRTYDDVLEYRADDPGADLATFPDWPVRSVPSPFQIQSEAVAYRVDGCGYLTTAEVGGTIDGVSRRTGCRR